ncbi:MAG: STAS/SEC14 domain-containing protein [Phenylobacterium sp.]|jgi:hypothetical protein|uniref:STAS/SEC14 domain-containing protein n=1 Tax=Phenylobacterium sp. TaxID=1871053 RepID=UPI002A36DDBD|nr:STAS/SEC14 domain-containing protein [Phenylobacterium sp.]MDX9998734.1 STAS/SEC14 domain-containing protein [Phenylobacterium sp.]
MIELLPAPDQVLAYRLLGPAGPDGYDLLTAQAERQLAGRPLAGVVADATDFAGAGPEAMMRDVRLGLSRLHAWRGFRRAALVTDRAWLKALVGLDPLVPDLEARAFAPEERATAIAWAAGEQPPLP